MPQPARLPVATYRLQFGPRMRFTDARALVPYLHGLGISDLYASPLLQAKSGSEHGYDVTDPRRLNPELGTEEEFRALCGDLRERGMGLILDIVPNHMAADSENPWWMEVLEHGRDGEAAGIFDIRWNEPPPGAPPREPGDHRLVLPILAEPYGRVLEGGALTLAFEGNGWSLRYGPRRLPLDFGTTAPLLESRRSHLEERLGNDHPALDGLRRIRDAVAGLPPRGAGRPEERRGRIDRLRAALAELVGAHPELGRHLEEIAALSSGRAGVPESFNELDDLLQRQPYRLAWWRLAAEALNYRRFFDVADLVGVRVEDPRVFERTHAFILALVREGEVTGLRIDHVDGLLDPAEYLLRIQEALAPAPAGGPAPPEPAVYVVVEKILTGEERLPREWPVHGTTGYDFIDALNGIYVDPEGLESLDRIYTRFIGRAMNFRDLLYRQKTRVMEELFGAEIGRLAGQLRRLAAGDRQGRDLLPRELGAALVQITATLPVYRTYIREDRRSPRDRAVLERALAEAVRRAPESRRDALAFLGRVLRDGPPEKASPGTRERWRRFVREWQQQTGAVMAKGLEDTALYEYNRLLALNYVGSDPDPDPATLTPRAFHAHNRRILEQWPHTLLSSSTHDSKRSEEVRARLQVLSEMPREWERALRRWSRMNARHRRILGARTAPGPNREFFFYQTLVGCFPLQEEEIPEFTGRMKRYLIKAAREAKVRTTWHDPDPDYEKALVGFVDEVLDPAGNRTFLEDFRRFQERIAFLGALNALGQLVLKVACPGVPDFYQGTESWNLRLVDPDNRAPVDFDGMRSMLASLPARGAAASAATPGELMARWADGRIKMHVMIEALRLRSARRALFEQGDYLPLEAAGRRADHLLAFARRLDGDWAICAVPIRLSRLARPGVPPLGRRGWGNTELRLPPDAPRRWRNALTGEKVEASREARLPARRVFATLPVAFLTASSEA